MFLTIKKVGRSLFSLPLLLFIIFSIVTPSLSAMGSGEFSKGYRDDLSILFKELAHKIELGEMDGVEAKAALTLLRSRYRVEYNDFAGKLDAIIDELDENKIDFQLALNDFTLLENDLIKVSNRELVRSHNAGSGTGRGKQTVPAEGKSSGRGAGGSKNKN